MGQTQPRATILAAGRKLSAAELTRQRPTDDELEEQPRLPIIAVLENIRSMWNVGSMFRTADAARLEQLFLCGYTPHPPRREIDKTALGATDYVPWQYWSAAPQACRWLRERGYKVLALEHTNRSVEIAQVQWPAPMAFVVGNEVTGISDETLAECHAAVELPMAGRKESLNVAVAFGVAAYTFRAQLDAMQPRITEPGADELTGCRSEVAPPTA